MLIARASVKKVQALFLCTHSSVRHPSTHPPIHPSRIDHEFSAARGLEAMSPFKISHNAAYTLSLSPQGKRAGPTYTLSARPHALSLVEELLSSTFRLVDECVCLPRMRGRAKFCFGHQETLLNRIGMFALNGDDNNTYRLIDVMTEHIAQHVVKVCFLLPVIPCPQHSQSRQAKAYKCPDELRQTHKEEGTQELQRLQSLVKPGTALLFPHQSAPSSFVLTSLH